MESVEVQLRAAAVLADPFRRSLYRYVRSVGREVGRSEAASAVGAGRTRVAAQLDRLAQAGLLEVSFRRLSARSGPGAGRPSKLYRPSPLEIDISVPPRRYDVVAELFAGALLAADVLPDAIDHSARDYGRGLGRRTREALERSPSLSRTVAALQGLVEDHGFEPVRAGRTITLANCPFRSLVKSRGQLVCDMNRSLFQGIVTGLGAEGVEVRSPSGPRGCCVSLGLPPPRPLSA
jgi:predicted ArsR family transcriptional regulator